MRLPLALVGAFLGLAALVAVGTPAGASAYPSPEELCGPPEPTERYGECVANAEEGAREEAEGEREEHRHAHQHRPPGLKRGITVRKKAAEYEVLHALHNALRWRIRTRGWIDCDGGRLNRIIWNCKFEWTDGIARDWCGHAQVTGERLPDGRGRYRIWWRAFRCP